MHLSPLSSTKQHQITQNSRNYMVICSGPIMFEKPGGRDSLRVGPRDALHRQEDFCSRGRPPRLPFSRELDAFRAEVFDPANRANSLIQVFEPKIPATSSATPKSASSASQCRPVPNGVSSTSESCAVVAPFKPCSSFGGNIRMTPLVSSTTRRALRAS